VYLRDIWPSSAEVREALNSALKPEVFREEYGHVFDGRRTLQKLPVPTAALYAADANSTYIQIRPISTPGAFAGSPAGHWSGAGAGMLGDSVTTITSLRPAQSEGQPRGKYLLEHGVEQRDFNSYGARPRQITR